jgi:uncharacterized protein YggE
MEGGGDMSRTGASLILFCAIYSIGSKAAAQEGTASGEAPPSDIAVSADAWAWNSPDTLRLSFLVEGNGSSAADAAAEARKKEAAIADAARKVISAEPKIQLLEEKFSSADRRAESLTPGSPLRVERLVGVETTSVDRAAALVDAVLKNGASSVLDLEYLVRNDEKTRAKAIEEAAARTRSQAEQAAAALGVKAGKVLNIGVTEEPEGKTLRLKRMRGEDDSEGSSRDTRWSVTVRYEIAR